MSSTQSSSLRASMFFLGGLCLAAALAVSQDAAWRIATQKNVMIDLGAPTTVTVQLPQPLDAADRDAARVAWDYVAKNTRDGTGLVDSVSGYPSTTLWDIGSHVLALVSARRLDLLPRADFEARAEKVVVALARMPLTDRNLPNKAYDTRSLAMVDYENNPTPEGIGWSALDIGRLLLALRALETEAPQMRPAIRAAVKGWDLQALAASGEIVGGMRVDGRLETVQEGRIGYEQYGARALMLWGVEATSALSAARILDWKRVEDIEVATDLRRPESFGSIDPVSSEPYILLGLELGLGGESAVLAERVYLAQEARFAATGHPTMVTEDHLDRAPRFVYGSVYGNGIPWAVLSDDGSDHPDLRTISTKAVFGWNALYGTQYTTDLRQQEISSLARPGEGWFAGRYETDGSANAILTLNTNAVILEALHFKALGPILAR